VSATSAETIAQVVSDLRRRRVHRLSRDLPTHGGKSRLRAAGSQVTETALGLVDDPVVVDATAIYNAGIDRGQVVDVYDDHPCIAPPWPEAAVSFVSHLGTAFVIHAVSIERRPEDGMPIDPWHIGKVIPREPCRQHTIDEDEVHWRTWAFMWLGGEESGVRIPTMGPVHAWELDVYADGRPADIRTVDINPDYPFETALVTLLGTLNFMSCSNVELVEPQRPRPERRRLEAFGVRVKTLHVYPVSRRARSGGMSREVGASPLTSVRGSFHHYGPRYGRGLLFGKYDAGKVWVPSHARGQRERGVIEKTYRPVPRATSGG
jgi:hypothetical protein